MASSCGWRMSTSPPARSIWTTCAARSRQKTKLVAVGYASNAVGTINDVATVIGWAREVGAFSFIDAVQFAPHGPIDVQALGCDFLVCSAYKFFGPHMGMLYGRLPLLESIAAYKVRPALDTPPYKWETGTLNHECLAGLVANHELCCRFGTPSHRPVCRDIPWHDGATAGVARGDGGDAGVRAHAGGAAARRAGGDSRHRISTA